METLGLAEMEMEVDSSFANSDVGSTQARSAFQWGGTIFALFLLLMNRTGRRSHMQTNLLVLYLFASFPTVLFKILRGQFGCWVAFLAVASNLFFPQTFPDRLRDDIVPGILCLIIAILVILTEIRGIGGLENCQCKCHCFGYWFGVACLFFFTILYLAT
ncbi:cold-regulated 413 plasma membrane protein 4-like isoform X2 [Durio zibethinus]|uniref:Cold-regulated 413 plasma membrane protein 4-like isoform X2 n=1 Tax=Durio zibethinus TaxID=66656 RepID=A0A6P5YH16_DURZI|nr:cold-regulated 413 plasma membrane protein 4-like isoform X2 [Durio zibethinus]